MTGKEKCELMKALRKEIAEANGIVYLTTTCNFEGDCPGFCPKCDAEARYLDQELNRLAKEGKTIKVSSVSYHEFLDKIETTNSYTYEIPSAEDVVDGDEPFMGIIKIDDSEGIF